MQRRGAPGAAFGGGGGGQSRRHPEHPPSPNLFINYVPSDVDEAQLTQVISMHTGGLPPLSVFVMRHLDTRLSKGYAFALFPSTEIAAHVKEALDGHQWGAKRLQVRFADPPCSSTSGVHAAGDRSAGSVSPVPSSGGSAAPFMAPTFIAGPNGNMMYMVTPIPQPFFNAPPHHSSDYSAVSNPTNETNLYIKGLPPHWSRTDLQSFFGQYGTIVDCALMLDQGRPTGMGFVEFADSLTANRVVLECNGRVCDPLHYSVPLHVRFAKNKKKNVPVAGTVVAHSAEAPLSEPQLAEALRSPTTSSDAKPLTPTDLPDTLRKQPFGPLLVHDPYSLSRYKIAPGTAGAQAGSAIMHQPANVTNTSAARPATHHQSTVTAAATATLPRVAPTAPLTHQIAHTCQYCKHGTSVIMENMPFDAAQCEIAVRKLLAPSGMLIYVECLGNGQAIATFAEHLEAVQCVQLLATGPHRLALLDCTQLEPTAVLGDYI